MEVKNLAIKLYAVTLLLSGFYLLFLFLVSGHRLNIHDFAQMKLLAEILIFIITGALLFSKKATVVNSLPLIILLLLVQLAFWDFSKEVLDEYDDNKPVLLLSLMGCLSIVNLLTIISFIRERKLTGN